MQATRPQTRTPPPQPFLATSRRDIWWTEPVFNVLGFTLFVIYATWVMFTPGPAAHPWYEWGPYLSPFYSPPIKEWFNLSLPSWFSPAMLILPAPLGFRMTCYYYRKMYYRSYMLEPAACAVADKKPWNYKGETAFPWILQNLHRWFLYLAIVVLAVLWYDAFASMWFQNQFHFGFGTALMLFNCVLLTGYTFGCHALRHLIGGNVDCWSCTKLGQTRHKLWSWVSILNEKHQPWAWFSMFSVGLTDLYVRMLAMHHVPYFPGL